METQKQVCILVEVHVAVNNIKGFGVVTERKQVVSFALLSSYRIFSGAVNILVPELFFLILAHSVYKM